MPRGSEIAREVETWFGSGPGTEAADILRLSDAVVGISGLPPRAADWWQFRALGAAALDLGLVAGGSLDAYADMSVDAHGAWDYLAGVLLVTEAGGVVADGRGRELVALDHADRRSPVAAATPELLEAVLETRR